MRKSSVKRLNGRVNGIHSEPNSITSSSSNNSVPAAVAATGSILAHTMMVSAAAEKVQQYRMQSATLSEDLPNVPSRASETYPANVRRTTITPGSSMNDSSDDLLSRPDSSGSRETASATSSFPTRTTTPHPLSKAPTLPCTSSEEGSDSPLFLRTISVQSLPSAPTIPTEISLYEKTLHLLGNDVNCQREIALGKRIGFYRLGKELGAGNFSKVKLGVHVLTKEKVAVKIMEKSKMDQKAQRLLAREIDNMEQLHHPNIIRLFECVETLSKMYLVMEYAGGGELYTYVHDKGKLTEDVAKPIFAQIISAVAHMHSKNIVHRDIKAENVIFSQPGWVKLADFGFSCRFENADSKLSTFCGSPPYAAPELFKDKNYAGMAVDIWALGVLLYFMLVGVTPFRGETVNDLKKNILAGSYTMPEYVSTFAQHIIHRMLEMDPTRRMGVLDVKKTYWLRESKFPESYLQLSMDPNEKELEKNEIERKVWNTLQSYGVSPEMIRESIGKGARNAIIGTYRIVLYQCQANEMDKERIKISEHLMQMAERNRRIHHQRLNERSKTSAIFLLHQESFACPKGTIEGLTSDVCYLFSVTKAVWEDAETECISYGGHLTSIGSAFKNAFLQTQAKEAFSNDANYYLGGSNVYALEEFNEVKQWAWIDGAPFSYQNFAPGQQPKESNEGYVYADIQSGQWYSDFDLNFTHTLRQYVCRLPNGRVDCNNGTYYYLNNKCYWSAGGQTFSEDTISCQNNSGNLASIHNDLDNSIVAIYNSFKADDKNTFIGLHQIDGNWVWQDGSPYNYSKWNDRVEPSSPKTQCVTMTGEYWYGGGELECEFFPGFCLSSDGICEKAVQVTPVKHVSEMRQEKKLRISREGLRRKHEKKFDTKKAQKC